MTSVRKSFASLTISFENVVQTIVKSSISTHFNLWNIICCKKAEALTLSWANGIRRKIKCRKRK